MLETGMYHKFRANIKVKIFSIENLKERNADIG